MRKHDDGYILVYVMVVLLVFCLVAATILTAAHRNLQNQQKTIEQMKDQYVAEGMIEKVMAEWNTYTWPENTEVQSSVGDTGVICEGAKNGVVTLSATYGTVRITCQVKDGKYITYDIGTAESPTTDTEEVLQ